jgi:hypothetical protein
MNINFEERTDLYVPESETILARLNTCRDADAVNQVVHEELSGSFGSDAVDSGRRYEQVAREIWEGWEHSAAATPPPPATLRGSSQNDLPPHESTVRE